MTKKLCRLLFHRLMGWREDVKVPFYDKCVICVAPHTSNWDLLMGKLFYGTRGRAACFMIKKEWFFFPLNLLFKAIGGIPIDRSRRTSTVEQMVERFDAASYFNLAITPEATRKANGEWKRGFYYIALQANVPIVLAAIDYAEKRISWERVFIPTGDFERDLLDIKDYFRGFHPKHPERFIL